RHRARDRTNVSGGEAVCRRRPEFDDALFLLYIDHAAVLALRRRIGIPDFLGPSLSLPHMRAPFENAGLHRIVGTCVVRRAADRIYLPLWTWNVEDRRASNHRPSAAGLAAARGLLERAALARRNQEMNSGKSSWR